MSTGTTPSKAKDKERIIKLLHESILHLCKVSVSGPGNIEVDGIVCITQPNESDIVVKVHETFSNVHSDKSGDGKSPSGEKRKHSSDGDGVYKRKDSGERQRTAVSRRLLNDGETLDLTKDDADIGVSQMHRSPHRNRKADVIDLTSGTATPAPQLNITQVRSLQHQRFGQTGRYQRFVSVRGRGGYQMVPRQRFMVQGQMIPGMRHMGQGGVRPVGGPIPRRGYHPQSGALMAPRAPIPGSTATMTTTMTGTMLATNGSRMGFDPQMQNYKGLHCKYKDCTFACSNKYYLETHVLQHFESDPFCCNEEGCEFKSKNKQNLYQHYKSTHDASNPQFCFKCMKAFRSPDDLAGHTQSCTVESIKCDHCGEMVMGKVAMAKHLTEVYIAESSRIMEQPVVTDQSQSQMSSSGTSQSPATTPSPGQTSMHSPTASSPQQQQAPESPRHSTQNVPDMSSPLNIIPDNSVSISQPASQTESLVQPELEQLQQLAGTPTAQVEKTDAAVSSPIQVPSLDYNPPTCNTVQYMSEAPQQQQQPVQPMNEPAMNPSLNMESPVQYQPQDRHYSNLELLNQPMTMGQPQLDPIQMPSLGDTMSLPEPDQIDTKPPDFNT